MNVCNHPHGLRRAFHTRCKCTICRRARLTFATTRAHNQIGRIRAYEETHGAYSFRVRGITHGKPNHACQCVPCRQATRLRDAERKSLMRARRN